jgi:hypothetical protein
VFLQKRFAIMGHFYQIFQAPWYFKDCSKSRGPFISDDYDNGVRKGGASRKRERKKITEIVRWLEKSMFFFLLNYHIKIVFNHLKFIRITAVGCYENLCCLLHCAADYLLKSSFHEILLFRLSLSYVALRRLPVH